MNLFNQINWALIAPLIVIELILKVIALIDWSKNKETNGPRWMWLLIILFINFLGSVFYFIFGRRQP